jgi:hypothetical protein
MDPTEGRLNFLAEMQVTRIKRIKIANPSVIVRILQTPAPDLT